MSYMIEDQPYKVIDLKTLSADHRRVSKLFTEKLGLPIPFTHSFPESQLLSEEHEF